MFTSMHIYMYGFPPAQPDPPLFTAIPQNPADLQHRYRFIYLYLSIYLSTSLYLYLYLSRYLSISLSLFKVTCAAGSCTVQSPSTNPGRWATSPPPRTYRASGMLLTNSTSTPTGVSDAATSLVVARSLYRVV